MDTLPPPSTYPIRAAARMTGLSVDTLRAWERRYAAVVPRRSEQGRVYSEHQIDRLRQLSSLVEAGHTIGAIAGLSDAALRKLRSGTTKPAEAPVMAWPGAAALLDALDAYDVETIEATLSRHALLLPPPEFVFAIALPVLREVGSRWEKGAICTAHEHLMSCAIRNVLGSLLRSMPRDAAGPRIVFATPAGQRHELGLLSAAVLAAEAGHPVFYLGPDVPADDIARAVKRVSATTLVLASTVEDSGEGGDVKGLRRLPKSVSIIAGGARAQDVQRHVGSRVRVAASLEDFRALVPRAIHA